MINVISKTCEINGCEEQQPRYGWLGKGKSHCGYHKKKGMITSPNQLCEIKKCRQLGVYENN